jgi:sugar phosphate permease
MITGVVVQINPRILGLMIIKKFLNVVFSAHQKMFQAKSDKNPVLSIASNRLLNDKILPIIPYPESMSYSHRNNINQWERYFLSQQHDTNKLSKDNY